MLQTIDPLIKFLKECPNQVGPPATSIGGLFKKGDVKNIIGGKKGGAGERRLMMDGVGRWGKHEGKTNNRLGIRPCYEEFFFFKNTV